MKNFAKLVLLFTTTFLIIILIGAGVRFLALHVEWIKILPPRSETFLTLFITAAHWALSLALFSTILFSLCYAGRRKYSAIMTICTLIGLSFLFCFGISFALEEWKSVPSARGTGFMLGNKGLILSNSLNRNETAVVLLNGASDPLGPRVIAVPNQSLIYHESAAAANNSENFALPPIPFGDDTPWFLKSLSIDIRLNAEMLSLKYLEGFLSFIFYAGSLIFLLCSFGYVIKLSKWPLANLFLGILAFRGILAIETFFNSPEMQEVIDSFLKGMVPVAFALPIAFFGCGLLLNLYSGLVFISKKRSDDGY